MDIGARLADICWLLRRDLSLAVYPHELRAATTLGQVAEIVGAIVAGESVPAALRPAPEEAPPTDTAKAADDRSAGPAPTARNERPIVFLLSAPRSGSTLLRLMLAGHPALFCPPELALLSAAGMREWRRRQLDLFARDGLTRSLMEIRGIPEAAARAQIAEMVREDRPIQRVYDDLQGELGARVLVDKSPAYALDPAALARAEELFAAPRYVVLTRHPAAVIDSCVRHRLEALLSRRPVDDPWRFAESVWTEANRNLAQLGERAGDRVLRLRYEDVVSSPEPATRRLADFLGLTWDEALLRPYDGGRMIDGPGDPDIFQHDGIDAALAEAWRSVRLPEPLLAETVALARDLGYAEPAAEPGEAPRAGLDAGQADDLLARLDELSDDEVAVTLGTLLDEEADS